jgi:outer membrane protein, multidrug efflux system
MRSTALALLCGLAFGCSLNPAYERPKAPVAENWNDQSKTGKAAADTGWREVLQDPRLAALVAFALENNRDLRATALTVEATRAQYRIQRADLFPKLGGSAGYTHERLAGDQTTSGSAVTTDVYTAGLAVTSFELDFFGRVRSLTEAALEQYLASEEARRSAHLTLVSDVATRYLTGRALEAQVALAEQTLSLVQRSLELTQASYQGGRANELDLRTAEAQVESARFSLSAARQQKALSDDALALLLGGPLPAGLPEGSALESEAVLELPAGVPSEVLQRRPDVLAAEHLLLATNANIGAARAAFFPSITLTAAGGISSTQLNTLFDGNSVFWSFAPRLDLPIFDAGMRLAALDAAHLRKEAQIARYEKAIQAAFREVADALVTRGAIGEQLAAQTALVAATQKRYELADLRYRAGIDSFLVVLTAQRDLFAAQQGLINARLSRVLNLVDLYRALGGGWLEKGA